MEMKHLTIPKKFYMRNPKEVAVDLLGKIVTRRYGEKIISGYIVEVEAYYGREDPASRARRGGNLAETMRGEVGVALIYGIHRQWLFNVVAHEKDSVGAVLIRAVHPLKGLELMMKFRGTSNLKELTNGPGKWTKAFKIDKKFHGTPLYLEGGELKITEGLRIEKDRIQYAFRIGVSRDLPTPLRFYIKDDPYVSRRRRNV